MKQFNGAELASAMAGLTVIFAGRGSKKGASVMKNLMKQIATSLSLALMAASL
jgi:hypothetical protein